MAQEKPTSLQDVSRPGTTPAIATSKPVIVGHTGMVVDPMTTSEKKEPVVAQAATASEAPAATLTTGSSKPKLAPISGQDMTPDAVDADNDKSIEKSKSQLAPAPSLISEEDKRQEKLAELVESGEYKVSIQHQKASSGSTVTFILTVLAIILIGVVVLFVLTDLKVLDLGVKLPVHIFKR